MGETPLRLAMWSGPRNISTAVMRAWENRLDTSVVDEPFYACFLAESGVDHPGRDEVLARYETDWRKVAASLTGPTPGGRRIHYQKHMTHHLLPHIGRDWMSAVTHSFLIRDPRDVILSYARRRPEMTMDDIGFVQQSEIFDHVCAATGGVPPVIDARDVLRDPGRTLAALCARLGVPFSERMLSWPAGPRETDGCWARYWYDAVRSSTGFAPYRRKTERLPKRYGELEAACRPHYERLAALRVTPP